MAFVLRFVQEYAVGDRAHFLELEERFADMERRRSDRPQGRRLQPYAGGEPTNTLIWEGTFQTFAEVQDAMERARAEILEILDL